MGKFYVYSLKLDENFFGTIMYPLPLMHEKLTDQDIQTWGRFFIQSKSQKELSFLMTKKLTELTNAISECVGINFPKNFILFPSISEDVDLTFSQNETEFIKSFVLLLNKFNFDFKEIYTYPSKPNMHIQDVYKTSYELKKLSESNKINLNEEMKEEILSLFSHYFPDLETVYDESKSVFPIICDKNETEYFSPGMSLLKFISYFRSFLCSLVHINRLISPFNVDASFFPYLIQSFSLEFIPSFVRNHNIAERLGDAILDVVVTHSMISALIGKKNYFLNKQIKVAVSNKLFGIIGEQFDFQNCFIGPFDVAKLPGDCFEAIVGSLYTVYGYEKVCKFWRDMLFSIPTEKLQEMDVMKAIESMKVGIESTSIALIPDEDTPENIKKLIGTLTLPPKDENLQLQIKCKLIGAALLKLSIVFTVISDLTCAEDTALIPYHSSKESLNKVAEKLGLKNSKYLRVLIGGLMLQNGFERTMAFVQSKVAPCFGIAKEIQEKHMDQNEREHAHRRHRHHH